MTQAEPVWYRLEVLTTESEVAAQALWDAGALGVEVQDQATFMEGKFGPVPDGQARLIAFFDAPFSTDALRFAHDVVSNQRFDDRSWETAWMEHFKPITVSRRAIVGPPWESFDAPVDGVKVVIEPGMAFGTGTHETTGVCATLIDELLDEDNGLPGSLLDVGCGTGVLSMIARGLGVPVVHGIDHDPIAIDVARDNLAKNGYDDVEVSTRTLSQLGVYDVVVANILAHILLTLSDDLHARVAPGGTLVASGITDVQADDFLRDFARPGFDLVERRDRGEWVALVWRRR